MSDLGVHEQRAIKLTIKNVCGCRAENLLISLITKIILVIENYSLGGYITFIHLVRTQHVNFVQEGFIALEKLRKWRRK